MDSDEYEIVSKHDLEHLRHDAKSSEVEQREEVHHLKRTMGGLQEQMQMLTNIFQDAVQELHDDDHEAGVIAEKINPINDKLTNLEEQNKKIASGLVGLNSLVDSKLTQISDLAETINTVQADFTQKINRLLDKVDMALGQGHMGSSHSHRGHESSNSNMSATSAPSPSGLPPLPPGPAPSAGSHTNFSNHQSSSSLPPLPPSGPSAPSHNQQAQTQNMGGLPPPPRAPQGQSHPPQAPSSSGLGKLPPLPPKKKAGGFHLFG